MTTRPRRPGPNTPAPGKLPLTELVEMKRRGERIAMVTAYDAPSARLADAAGADLILVGDSAAMVMLGHDSTVPATVDELLVLTRAVTRGAKRPIVIADMPFGSFQISDERALENAVRFVKQYARLGPEIQDALERYAADVRSGAFPEAQHTYGIPEEELALFEAGLDQRAHEHQ